MESGTLYTVETSVLKCRLVMGVEEEQGTTYYYPVTEWTLFF
jgi:hypothetical protein